MSTQPEALRLAEIWSDYLPAYHYGQVARDTEQELRRLHHNNQVLTDALWKACGDDEEVVNSIIASQGELK